jgi:hypothetical protein
MTWAHHARVPGRPTCPASKGQKSLNGRLRESPEASGGPTDIYSLAGSAIRRVY